MLFHVPEYLPEHMQNTAPTKECISSILACWSDSNVKYIHVIIEVFLTGVMFLLYHYLRSVLVTQVNHCSLTASRLCGFDLKLKNMYFLFLMYVLKGLSLFIEYLTSVSNVVYLEFLNINYVHNVISSMSIFVMQELLNLLRYIGMVICHLRL